MSPGSVGNADDADAPCAAGITISGKSHAGLVGKCNDFHPLGAAELEEEVNDQVARDAEKVGDADFFEIADEIIAQFHSRLHDSSDFAGAFGVQTFQEIGKLQFCKESV